MTSSEAANPTGMPHDFDHRHPDVSGGWLRAATFGAMDGLVSNTALVAGVGGAGVAPHSIVLSGVAGLLAGAFSMALGEYTSVETQNEQLEAEVRVEQRSFRKYPRAELAELTAYLQRLGISEGTATVAAKEMHLDTERAINFHITQELGIDPQNRPSPLVAAGSSFAMFAVGAIFPLIPFLLGWNSLLAGMACGGFGLLVAGALAARFTARRPLWAALRQLFLGGLAIGATYLIGSLIGSIVP